MKSLYFDVNLPRIAMTKALGMISSGVYYSPLSTLCYGEVEEPKIPEPSWVKVKPTLCGICGGDMHLITLQINPKISLAALPKHNPKGAKKYLGHEVVGEVVEVGSEVTRLAVGDRVALQKGPCCETLGLEPCAMCEQGDYSICQHKSEAKLPANMGGGFSEFFVVHEAQLFQVPDGITDEQAALLEPTACSVRTVLRRPPEDGDKVLVMGGGIIGLNTVQAARIVNPGCFITALVKYPYQAETAKRLGADEVLYTGTDLLYDRVAKLTGGKSYTGKFGNQVVMGGFDVIYDAVGSAKTLHESLRWVRTRGTVVLVGSDKNIGRFDYTPLWHQEISLIGSEAHGEETYQDERLSTFALTARFLLEGKMNLDGLLTHTLPLSRYKEAIKVLMNKRETKAIKAAFRFGGGD
jgi:threonine dehydrogenase-like Zn-dependent dehydrogenase